MKYLPYLTLLIWAASMAGLVFVTDVFLQSSVKFTAISLLAVLLSTSFWFYQSNGAKLKAIVMVCVFIFNVILIFYGLFITYSAHEAFAEFVGDQKTPGLSLLLDSGSNQNHNPLQKKVIFGKQVNNLPTLEENETTKDTRAAILSALRRKMQIVTIRREISYQLIELFLMLGIHVTIFTALLVYFTLYDKPANPSPE